jgi:hypothetical protein
MVTRARPGSAKARGIPLGVLIAVGAGAACDVLSIPDRYLAVPTDAESDVQGADAGPVPEAQAPAMPEASDAATEAADSCAACGAIGTCSSGCAPDPCVLACDQSDPNGLALDSSHVYWTNRASSVRQVDKTAANLATLSSGSLNQPYALVLATDDCVYWSDYIQKTIRKSCRGAVADYASTNGFPAAIAADGTRIFWFENAVTGTSVQSCFLGTCESPATVATSSGDGSLVVFPGIVVWAPVAAHASIVYCSVDGCEPGHPPVAIVQDESLPVGLAAASAMTGIPYLVWGDSLGRVRRCILPFGAQLETVTTLTGRISSVFADAKAIYVGVAPAADDASPPSGKVFACPLEGPCGTPSPIVDGLATPSALAADGTYLYVAESAGYMAPGGRILRKKR